MAGVYPNAPGHRFAYDVDGSTVQYRDAAGTLSVNLSQAQMQTLQNESGDYLDLIQFDAAGYLCVLFPEARNVTGVYVSDEYGLLEISQYSTDSTDGWGGTWTTFTSQDRTTVIPEYRTAINVVNLTNVTALKFKFSAFVNSNYPFGLRTVHIYGDYAVGGDRLEFWHPTLDQKINIAHFDLGDVKRGATLLKEFRIKNISSTLTANSIGISAGALTVGTPSHATMHTFSTDNITYSASINIGNLAPGAISGVLYDKFVSSMTTPTGPWSGRLSAVAGSWT